MASPPYSHNYTSANSPPYPSNAQLPQPPKRRQSDMPSSAPALKRRKASMLSTTSGTSSHPLRQTSFPPESTSRDAFSRSPTSDTMSLVSTGTKKKRVRKSKGGANNDASSVVNGTAKSTISNHSAGGRKRRRASRDDTVEEEEEQGGNDMAVQMAADTLEERKKEMEHRAMLTGYLDQEQFARYEAWRSSKLSDTAVRKLVNQVLSQSAPANVILAVKSVAKIFAGEMIEGARKVQTQWIEQSGEDQATGLPFPPTENGEPREKETRRGPLLPDHLREAMRRKILTREGGLTGQLDLWHQQSTNHVERFGVKVGGKRLFK